MEAQSNAPTEKEAFIYPSGLSDQITVLSNFLRTEFHVSKEHDLGCIPTAIELLKEHKRIMSMVEMSDFEEFSFCRTSLHTMGDLLKEWQRKHLQKNIFAPKNIEALRHDIALLEQIVNNQGWTTARYFETKYGIQFKVLSGRDTQNPAKEE